MPLYGHQGQRTSVHEPIEDGYADNALLRERIET
jgi:hypothetical protein